MKRFIGETITKIEGKVGYGYLVFSCASGKKFKMFHEHDCCEDVHVDEIIGDIQDIIGSPIVLAEESTSNENPEGVKIDCQDSFTWTFYRLGTIRGDVVIRWYGESNGYYSEDVDIEEIK